MWGSGPFGVAARKMLFLPPGAYVLRGSVRYNQRTADGFVGLSLECLNGRNTTTVWRQHVSRDIALAAALPAPGGCEAYYLQVGVDGGSAGNIDATVGSLELARGDSRVASR